MKPRLLVKLILLGVLLSGCEDLERSNPLDPKNPHSRRPRTVLVEAFVNEGTGQPYCGYSREALEQVATEFGSTQLVIVEQHLRVESWTDSYGLEDSNQRYDQYVQQNRGVTHVFIDGTSVAVQGASSAASVKPLYAAAINVEMTEASLFAMECRKSQVENHLDVEVKIARLGTESESNFSVGVMLFEKAGTSSDRLVIRKILPFKAVDSIKPGEQKVLQFSGDLPAAAFGGIVGVLVFIQEGRAQPGRILQAQMVL